MNSEIPYRFFSIAQFSTGTMTMLFAVLLLCQLPQNALAQDRLQELYTAQAIQKHKIKSIEVLDPSDVAQHIDQIVNVILSGHPHR